MLPFIVLELQVTLDYVLEVESEISQARGKLSLEPAILGLIHFINVVFVTDEGAVSHLIKHLILVVESLGEGAVDEGLLKHRGTLTRSLS